MLLGLLRTYGKRPDGNTQIPWARGKPLTWDVTIPDTFAKSHLNTTSALAGAAANHAATAKKSKYVNITATHIFTPIAIETAGSWNQEAIEIRRNRKSSNICYRRPKWDNLLISANLYSNTTGQCSLVYERFLNWMKVMNCHSNHYTLIYNFQASGFVLSGELKNNSTKIIIIIIIIKIIIILIIIIIIIIIIMTLTKRDF